MRGFLAKDKKSDHTQMSWSPANRPPRRKMRRPSTSSARRNLYKRRGMYSPAIKLNTPTYLAIRAASAVRKAQIASAKARRAHAANQANLARARKNLMSKFGKRPARPYRKSPFN